MREALYRKYRSKSLSEIVGQEHITDTLHRAVEAGKISHAYLFTGPRGVGKTSIARILAYQINGIPYTEHEAQHLDIIEIDAASNRRIDEIRDLKERVHVAPAQYKYKVYIIDEVHMLTKEAFNALLKTLEEPPAHVVFILATTELHKLPETIISRTQRYGFKPIPKPQVIERLQEIANNENVVISGDALELIAEHGEGSFRDSISLLDQVQHIADEITAEHVQASLGLAPRELVDSIVKVLQSQDVKALKNNMDEVKERGIQIKPLVSQLSDALLKELIAGKLNKQPLVQLLRELGEAPAHRDPSMATEIALYEYIFSSQVPQDVPQIEQVNPTKAEVKPARKPLAKKSTSATKTTPPEEPEKTEEVKPIDMTNNELTAEIWENILSEMKKTYNTLYGVVRMAKPALVESELILEFNFPFHQKRLKEQKNQQILIAIFKKQTSKVVTINPVVAKAKLETPKVQKSEPKNDKNEHVETVSNIFGGAEVVES